MAGEALVAADAGAEDVDAAGVLLDVVVDELRATTMSAIKIMAATTATTTRLEDFVAGLEPLEADGATEFEAFGADEIGVAEEVPRVGTGGITIVDAADFLATFLVLFLTADFFAVDFLATFLAEVFFAADFFTADFFAVFFTADFLAVFFAVDFFAVVFFTATELLLVISGGSGQKG
jgi:hypothetical protein